MKGIIFNLLEEVISRGHGEDAWDAILEVTAVRGVYTALGNYPDEDLEALVTAAAVHLDLSPRDLVRHFGREALPLLAVRFPAFFERHRATVDFLLTLNQVIHPEVRKLYPGADVPEFGFDVPRAGALRMTYRSPRRLCALAEGFIEGAADYYRERVVIHRPACMLEGARECVLDCSFESGG